MDETTITGNLPNMTIEISHRADPEGGAEMMTIQLRAMPDFQTALPLAGSLLQGQMLPLMAPMQMWSQAMDMWTAPWRQLAEANPLLRLISGK
ncbi:MAG: hypothetical protein HYU59_03390 [Magnetospirillum gryphiswaldense]|uniref:hypothetical protein n=1 Tax=Magnetospirillum sp. 64-120 TaxID=1895778 RepID=UPI00092C0DAE|nr:hypothetical protein [Magnetospirillum sp. 64-120]MBI2239829.1 hypothetical protein [Magnetospirillum gryphiswaldense]OJX80951.1 MAG: hypothetical protein BGO92_07640 [Magnetospirillum sp. 64-120]